MSAGTSNRDQVTNVALLGQRVDDIVHDLYGNGQPGVLGRMESRLDKIEDKLTRVIVTVALLAGGSGAALGAVAKSLLGG